MMVPLRNLFLISLSLFFLLPCLTAQNLFTLDGSGVSKEEFLKAYNKNNNTEKPNTRSYRDYLELYIRYKLKVRAAYETHMDTLPAQRTELQNFRNQVAETYLKDEASLDRLVKEVFERGQKDIHLAHIFIPFANTTLPQDTLPAYEKVMAAYNALKKGKKFDEVARAWSGDPSVKRNGGDLGYITVFTLPYELENLAYITSPNSYSKPWRSKGGYHIFRNMGERKALGRMKAAQILLSFPPDATEAVRSVIRQRADSIYGLLVKGADFATLARAYSGDNLSYQNAGELPEFGIGRYDSAFETAAFALDKDGAISRPIPSAYGFHIIRRISRTPFPNQLNEGTLATIKQQIQNDPRVEVSRKALLAKVFRQTELRRSEFSEPDLWVYTDSAQGNAGLSSFRGLSYSTVLFSFSRQSYTLKGWLDFVRVNRPQRGASAPNGYKALFEKYIERSALDYYRSHLEEYNKDFAFQLTEFKEGNLLFEIMQKNIWDKASTDSAGLRNYYESHKDHYWWESSAEALLFTCNSQKAAEDLKQDLERNGFNWRKGTDSAGVSVQADSGRYEWTQIPALVRPASFQARQFTDFVPNKSDNTISFAYILNVYPGRAPRNYRDARGFVINDYQSWLEDQWVVTLKKKYSVRVDEGVLAGLPK